MAGADKQIRIAAKVASRVQLADAARTCPWLEHTRRSRGRKQRGMGTPRATYSHSSRGTVCVYYERRPEGQVSGASFLHRANQRRGPIGLLRPRRIAPIKNSERRNDSSIFSNELSETPVGFDTLSWCHSYLENTNVAFPRSRRGILLILTGIYTKTSRRVEIT